MILASLDGSVEANVYGCWFIAQTKDDEIKLVASAGEMNMFSTFCSPKIDTGWISSYWWLLLHVL
jgi:hypothetical protein